MSAVQKNYVPTCLEPLLQQLERNKNIVSAILATVFLIGGIVCVTLGIQMLSYPPALVSLNSLPSIPSENTLIFDYTDCLDENAEDLGIDRKCVDTLAKNIKRRCKCLIKFKLAVDLKGKVIVYYELDYDQFYRKKDLQFNESRDSLDSNLEPSERRERPACGVVPGTMFNDSFTLQSITGYFVPMESTGIIEKEDNICDLKNSNGSNDVEDEMYIAWRRTDWVRKPVWRVDTSKAGYETGLKQGSYGLRTEFNYPASLYNGTRKVVITNVHTFSETPVRRNYGSLVVIIGVVQFGIVFLIVSLFVYKRHKSGSKVIAGVLANVECERYRTERENLNSGPPPYDLH